MVKYFICYAREDKTLRDKLMGSLTPFLKSATKYKFEPWSDDQIELGSNWRGQIESALKKCGFGLLLVSPNFLASEFIVENELPKFVPNDPFCPADGKLAAPVMLKPILLDGSMNLRGLEQRQIFRDDSERSFQECTDNCKKDAFARALFGKIIAMLNNHLPSPGPKIVSSDTVPPNSTMPPSPGKSDSAEQADHRQQFKAKLIDLLKTSSETATESLAKGLGLGATWGADALDQRVDQLADRLLNSSFERTIDVLRGKNKELVPHDRRSTSKDVADAADLLAKIAQLIAPALYEYRVVVDVRSRKTRPDMSLIELPAHFRTVAEIIMASHDCRETRFRPREDDRHFPEGELALPLSPEGGLDAQGEKAAAAVREHLAAKIHLHMADQFIRDMNGYLYRRFITPDVGAPKRSSDEEAMLAKEAIDRKMKKSHCSFYVRFHPPEDEMELKAMDTVAKNIKEYYPSIMCLVLNGAFELERAERTRYDNFIDMLPLKGSSTP